MSMEVTARALVTGGKGILAADESLPTIEKRFQQIDLPSTEHNRRAYREMLFSTPGIEDYIGGVILFEETLRQEDSHGVPLVKLLQDRKIIPGIKVDKGAKSMPRFPGEKLTQGLDGLHERLVSYRELGAEFTKWRAVITIGEQIPTNSCIKSNAHHLALFAAASQEAGLVPIVEPEVLMDGSHDIDECEHATEAALYHLFEALYEHRVSMEEMLLKCNMVVSGTDCATQAPVDEVAFRTLRCLRHAVPSAVPGIAFLSGGQTAEAATERLNAMNKMGPHPWALSFSFGRALQDAALHAWRGNNVPQGQEALYHRARLCSLARVGLYSPSMETESHSIADMYQRRVAA